MPSKYKSKDSTTKKYATKPSKAKPSDLGTGMASRAAKAILKRKKKMSSY